MYVSNEMQMGKAGEYLVCADLIMKGFIAYPSEQGLPYDVVLDIDGKLLKIQVKTAIKPRLVPQRKNETQTYIFDLARRGKSGRGTYSNVDVDIFALVALDKMEVGYIAAMEDTKYATYRVDELRGTYYDEKGLSDFAKVTELYKTIKNKSEIARIVGIDDSIVGKMLKDGYKPHISSAKYFSEIKRDRDWFFGYRRKDG